jgi:hypothetical protein
MDLDLSIALAGAAVGFTVGLTGMGGGALMTPLLVLVFGVQPLAAVSSDLVASMVMKPIGGGVHLRQGTVHRGVVTWLMLGSIPAAFSGVLLLKALGDDAGDVLEPLLGVALLVASAATVARTRLASRRGTTPLDVSHVAVRRAATVAVGVGGGVIVGLTSVGAGSLMIVLMLSLYPRLDAKALVGTDLVQAVPLVGAAALGHLLFGDVRLGITTSLLVGAVPAVYVGARLSSRADDRWIRPVLVAVLVASALKLLDVATVATAAAAVAAGAATVLARRPHDGAVPQELVPASGGVAER